MTKKENKKVMINANEINSSSNSNSNNINTNQTSGINSLSNFDHIQSSDRMNSNHPDNNNSSNCEADLDREVEGKLNKFHFNARY